MVQSKLLKQDKKYLQIPRSTSWLSEHSYPDRHYPLYYCELSAPQILSLILQLDLRNEATSFGNERHSSMSIAESHT